MLALNDILKLFPDIPMATVNPDGTLTPMEGHAMCELPGQWYEAATRAQKPACGEPREWWAVIGNDLECASLHVEQWRALAQREADERDYPRLGPWRVVKLTEQTA